MSSSSSSSSSLSSSSSNTSSSSSILDLPVRNSNELPIYLDYNATTPISESVSNSILPFLNPGIGFIQSSFINKENNEEENNNNLPLFGNASSSHIYGSTAK